MPDYRTTFLQYPVDNISMPELLEFVNGAISEDSRHFIAVQNANKMYLSQKYPVLKDAIDKASIILPENSLNIGKRLLGSPLKQRNMGGVHAMEEFLKLANEKRYSVYFLGATHVNLELLVKKIAVSYPNVIVAGYHHGYFSDKDDADIVEDISSKAPNLLFVGMGSPKQEFFIIKYLNQLKINIVMGVGGSFNVVAGLEKPAPQWTKYGFEWLFRSFQDPKKFKRYFIINSFFMYSTFKYILLKK